jgi:hypothetical protein
MARFFDPPVVLRHISVTRAGNRDEKPGTKITGDRGNPSPDVMAATPRRSSSQAVRDMRHFPD